VNIEYSFPLQPVPYTIICAFPERQARAGATSYDAAPVTTCRGIIQAMNSPLLYREKDVHSRFVRRVASMHTEALSFL